MRFADPAPGRAPSSGPRWRGALVDLTAAALLPIVLFLIPFNAVVSANVNELLYHPSVARGFLIAGVIAWLVGALIVRRWQDRALARLWVTLPWAILILDVAGAALTARGVGMMAAGAADAAVLVITVVAAILVRWPALRSVAAAAAGVLFIQGAVAHASLLRGLKPELMVGSSTAESRAPAPRGDSPGNVYHILLDGYQSEAFAYSIGDDGPRRYPGFTYYTRFNTNFPHTSSAEPAMVHGRAPTPGMSVRDWPDTALKEGFWTDLSEARVGVWLYPYGRSLCHPRATECVTSTDLERDAGATGTRDATIDLWAIRVLPAALVRRLDPDGDGDGRFSATAAVRDLLDEAPAQPTAPAGVRALPTQYFNLKQFDELLADESRRPARGQYVYYHGLIPHHDYLMNSRCELIPEPRYAIPEYWDFVGCANLMIERLVDRLRELDRLDAALIIVHADHGDPNFLVAPEWMGGKPDLVLDPIARTYQPLDATYRGSYEKDIMEGDSAAWRSWAVEMLSSGLLLVKTPHATSYAEDTRPVQLLDIAPTVLAHFGLDRGRYDGASFSEVTPGREWMFYAHSRGFDEKLSQYRLTPQGWQFAGDITVRP